LRGGISRKRDPFPPGNPIWYEWCADHATYKCRLCDSYIPNDSHLCSKKHTTRTANPQYYWDADRYPWDPCIWAVEHQSELQYISAELRASFQGMVGPTAEATAFAEATSVAAAPALAEATSVAAAPAFAEAPRVEVQPPPFPDDVRRLEGYFAALQTTPENVVPCAASTAAPQAPAFADAGAGPAVADSRMETVGPAERAEDEQETAGRAEPAEEDRAGRAAEVEAEEEPPPLEDAGGSRRRSRSAGFNKQSLRSFRPPSLAPEDRSTKQ